MTRLRCDCDLLVPAATADQIDAQVADELRARAVLEIANGPTTCDADPVLRRRGVRVVPDLLANCGGVTVSHMEWSQNLCGQRWSLERVNAMLAEHMQRTAGTVRRAREAQLDYRQAAYVVALRRLAEAACARGIAGLARRRRE